MIGTLIKKDLSRKIAQPGGFLLLVALPLILALILGTVFGGPNNKEVTIRVQLLLEDHDRSLASRALASVFSGGELAELFSVQPVDSGLGQELMDAGKASALLIIPAGFGDSLLNQKPTTLRLIKNPAEAFLPKIAQETVTLLADGGDRLLHLAAGPIQEIRRLSESEEFPPDVAIATVAVEFNRLIRALEPVFFPPLLALHKESTPSEPGQETTKEPEFNLFAYLLTGNSILLLFFLIDTLSRDIFVEKEKRTLDRMATAPLSIRTVVIAKLLFNWLAASAALLLVWLLATLVFAVSIPRLWLFVPLCLLIAAALTGITGFLYALFRTRGQASAVMPALILIFGLFGGSMVPIGNLPEFLRALSVVSPIYWSADALQSVLFSRDGWSAIAPNLLVLGLTALIFLSTSGFLYERRMQR